MSDETAERFDPRFDPAFQRGFDPAASIAQSIPEPVTRPHLVEEPPPRSLVTPGVPFVPIAPASTPPPAISEPVDAAQTTLVELARVDAVDVPSLRRNPYLIALGIIAIVLVVAGIWLFVESGAAFDGREVLAQGDYMSLVASIQVAPFISILGAATAIGVLFMIAGRWRKKG
jgi:hypothetical protein